MGDYAVLDPVPGGEFSLDINGVPVRGRYLEVDRSRRLLLSWGHAGSERLPPAPRPSRPLSSPATAAPP
jgi:hypothetical protein